jgi:hypothetical protein
VANPAGSFPWSDKNRKDAYIEKSTCGDTETKYTKVDAEASSPGNPAYDKYLEGWEALGECSVDA